ncbi:type II secretion system F family protein [Corynebacterium ulceribovis]|uniref:type II secretion system F family protein n=1 Tax=Corynebacterium ulceribovis TaxID=487732 RepID=UPI00036BA226|nr:type II secretion system F family protein [Corynebacterium ulceribovis]
MNGQVGAALMLVAGALVALPTAQPARRLGVTARTRERRRMMWPAVAVAALAGVWLGALPLVAGAIGTWAVSKAVLTQRGGQRRRQAQDQLAEIVELAAADMRAGALPRAAIAAAAEDVGGTVGAELALAARRMHWGQGAEAFAAVGEAAGAGTDHRAGEKTEVNLSRLRHLWVMSTEHGVSLGELFQQLSADLTARHNHRQRLMASLAGPRTTMWILAALPLFGIAMGQAMGTESVEFLLFSSIGSVVLIVGVAFMSAGLVWAVHLTESAGELG